MKIKQTISMLAAALFLFTACQEADVTENEVKTRYQAKSGATRKVLIVGIDGLQYEKIAGLTTPNLQSLTMTKAYTGGISGTSSEQATYSGPGWMSILTGVWQNKHGIPDNNSTTYRSQAKSVFQYVKESNSALKTASIATWSPIHQFLDNQMQYVDYRYEGGDDNDAESRALNEITTHAPDLLFVHFDDVDHVGHASGFSSAYNSSIEQVDVRLGKLMVAVATRNTQNNEDWLVIVVTDHGREASGFNHGSQTEQEKTIFIGMNKPGNEEFTTPVTTIPNQAFNKLYSFAAQTSVVPTALTYLGIEVNKDWQLASTSLIDNMGVRKLMLQANNSLYWYSQDSGTAQIYRDNQLIASVPANQGSYTDTNTVNGKVNYTIMLNGQSASLIRNNSTIIAGLDWNDAANNTAYFFRSDMKYVRYNKSEDKADAGYPKNISNSSWPGLDSYKNKISASLKWNNQKGFFFLNDGTYLRYDMNNDATDAGYPKAVNNSTWPGLQGYGNKIVGAINWDETFAYFFLNDGTFIKYNMVADASVAGYPQAVSNTTWPGLAPYATAITATVDWNVQYFYIFLNNNTYIKYDKTANTVMSGYPKQVNDSTWPGLMN
jgi:hypothetical protein